MGKQVAREEGNFDDWLHGELHRELSQHVLRPAPPPRYRSRARGRRRGLSLLTGTSAALGAKGATGLFVTAFAVAVTGAAVTGSANPAIWGSHMRTAVSDCKSDLVRGQRGWGDCVNSVAGQVQPQAPAPVVEAPTANPQAASSSRIDDVNVPPAKAPVPVKVAAPGGGKTITPPRSVHSSPTPQPDDNRDQMRRGGGS